MAYADGDERVVIDVSKSLVEAWIAAEAKLRRVTFVYEDADGGLLLDSMAKLPLSREMAAEEYDALA